MGDTKAVLGGYDGDKMIRTSLAMSNLDEGQKAHLAALKSELVERLQFRNTISSGPLPSTEETVGGHGTLSISEQRAVTSDQELRGSEEQEYISPGKAHAAENEPQEEQNENTPSSRTDALNVD